MVNILFKYIIYSFVIILHGQIYQNILYEKYKQTIYLDIHFWIFCTNKYIRIFIRHRNPTLALYTLSVQWRWLSTNTFLWQETAAPGHRAPPHHGHGAGRVLHGLRVQWCTCTGHARKTPEQKEYLLDIVQNWGRGVNRNPKVLRYFCFLLFDPLLNITWGGHSGPAHLRNF